MVRDPDLAALRAELERLGSVVAPHGDHLCVRLPLFASVRVRLEEGRLRCQPLFGPLPRSRALVLGMAAMTALVGGAFYGTGVSPVALTAAFGGIMAGVADACRFVLTESCVTRVQMLWAARTAPGGPALAAAAGLAGVPGARSPNEALPAAPPERAPERAPERLQHRAAPARP